MGFTRLYKERDMSKEARDLIVVLLAFAIVAFLLNISGIFQSRIENTGVFTQSQQTTGEVFP